MSSLDKKLWETELWRSLDDWQASSSEGDADVVADVVNREFPTHAAELSDPPSRRRFMQLMGASVAFAGVAGVGCRRWEKEEIVPLGTRPADYIPGNPRHFATAFEMSGVASALVVTSIDGRPIKIEGNGDHPFLAALTPREQGAVHTTGSSAYAQASILGLYDPDRSGFVRRKEDTTSSWDDFAAAIKNIQGPLRVLSEATSSPTLARLKNELMRRFPDARWYEWDPLSRDNERVGLEMAFEQTVRPLAQLDQAKVIVSVDADLFYFHPAAVRYGRDFAKVRDPDQPMARLYSIESAFTTTGSKADHRLAVPSSQIAGVLAQLDGALQGRAPQGDEKTVKFVTALAQELQSVGNGVLIAGPNQDPSVHVQVAAINQRIRANGSTLDYLRVPPGSQRPKHSDAIKELAKEMNDGKVKNLLILGGNPVYDAPADVQFAAGLGKVETSIHLSEHHDETSAACTWHLPRANYLEAWGDTRTYDGTVVIQQPLIQPMWDGKSAIEIVSLFINGEYPDARDLVRATFGSQIAVGGGEAAWREALHDGFVANTRFESASINTPVSAPPVSEIPAPTAQSPEITFTGSSHTYDGRFANNGWLQETPDFMTKLTWDNAALVNPNTAEELGIEHGDMVRIEHEGRSIEVAVYTMPGQARNSIAVSLGHGRTRAGRVAGSEDDNVAPTGFNAYGLRGADAMFIATGAKVTKTGGSYVLASTQDHWKLDAIGQSGMEQRMPTLIRSCDVDEYQKFKAAKTRKEQRAECYGEVHEVKMPLGDLPGRGKTLWKEHQYGPEVTEIRSFKGTTTGKHTRYKWGMSIDLNKCTGCNACMLACQSENNVTIVGKEQVLKSREMHWMRIDRYFTGGDLKDDPEIAFQPVTCQQCEMAPCEQVCPVGATIHSHEGLNDMVYNRCVGTRYCLNNCPYKVRRFNFLDYHNRPQRPGGSLADARNKVRELLFNPDVTVRSRGVMEKCTFCVQRIQNKKIVSKNEGRTLRDLEIVTACQEACPSNAIVFGDLNDPDSQVSKTHQQIQPRNKAGDNPENQPGEDPIGRGYELLSELNLKTRNIFLAEVRNPNRTLRPAEAKPAGHDGDHGKADKG